MADVASDISEASGPFDGLTIEWAQRFLAELNTPEVQANRRFFEGDHWQDGDGWVGPRPDNGKVGKETVHEVMRLIERNFVSKNVVREVVERHASSVVGREANWRFVRRDGDDLSDADKERVKRVEAALTDWWDDRKVGEVLIRAVDRVLYAERAHLRLYVPARFLRDDLTLPKLDFAEALKALYVEDVGVDVAGVFEDDREGRRVGVYLVKEGGKTYAELSGVTDDGMTVVRRQEEGSDDWVDSSPLALGGRLPLIPLERPALISEQVRQNQRLVNMAVTMMARNVVLAGYLERTIVNAEMPGEYVTDPDTGRKVFEPRPLNVGAGVTNLLQSVVVEDSQGRTTALPTNVIYRDPVDPGTFIATKRDAQENIYDEVKQRHVLIAGDATASGVSRQQAMDDFEADLSRTKMAVDRTVQALLETAVAMAAHFSGHERDFLEVYKAVADARVRMAPPTTEEQRVAVELRDAEVISTETAMGRVGVDDPAAELQKIRQERDDDIEAGRTPIGERGALAFGPLPTLRPPAPEPDDAGGAVS